MDKILSSNTIKNVFSALGAKTSDSNYAVALLNKTSAAPAGFMDMSNLASVLGAATTGTGLLKNTLSTPSNYDDPSLSGVYAYAPSGTGASDRGMLFAYPNTSSQNGYRAIQVAFLVDGKTMSRTYESNRWGTWYRTDNYGTTSLSELASALGVTKWINSSSDLDLNSINYTVNIQWNSSTQKPQNIPSGFDSSGQVHVIQSDIFIFQMAVDRNSDMWIRSCFGNTSISTTWKKVTTT